MHVSLVKRAIEQFSVSTTTVDVLFMFDGELNNERFFLSGDGLEFRGQSVEFGVLAGLDTLVLIGITVKFACGPCEFSGFCALMSGLNPSRFPIIYNEENSLIFSSAKINRQIEVRNVCLLTITLHFDEI